MAEELHDRVLCDVDDVKGQIPGVTTSHTAIDPKIKRFINSESTYMHDRAKREFKPRAANPQTRHFDLTREDVDERVVEIGDLMNTDGLVVRIKDLAGATLETVATANYVLLERNREPWEPYTAIWFPRRDVATPAALARGYVLELVGNFGFPEIPDDLRMECALNVAARVAATLPVTDQTDEDSAPRALRASYRETDSHRVPTVG